MSATLPDIRDRIAAATGASEEIDARILAALFAPADAYVEQSKINGAWCIYRGEWQGRPKLFERPPRVTHELWRAKFTKSVDDALALAEWMLPDLMWRLQSEPDGGDGYVCYLIPGSGDGGKGEGSTPPLAMLAALLTTLISESENAR